MHTHLFMSAVEGGRDPASYYGFDGLSAAVR